MAAAHLIHGYIGAGKTTFARRLERELPAVRFTHDEWMARLYGRDPPADLFAEYAARVSDGIDALWPRCLELGLDVVLDLNFWTRRHRDEARARAAAVGGATRLYRLACSDDEALRRIGWRNKEESGLLVSPTTFELLRPRFEPLNADEPREEVRFDPFPSFGGRTTAPAGPGA